MADIREAVWKVWYQKAGFTMELTVSAGEPVDLLRTVDRVVLYLQRMEAQPVGASTIVDTLSTKVDFVDLEGCHVEEG